MAARARRVALVTGGGRGIGREVALALARGGYAVAVAARTRAELDDVAAAARRLGVDAVAQVLDVTDAASVTRAVDAVATTLGPVDVLVNNAGIAESAPLLKTDPALIPRCPRCSRARDRKSTRLNSSHGYISYAVFCLKKKKKDSGTSNTIDENRRRARCVYLDSSP